MEKQNCWEDLKCGREPGGANCESLGICPASQPGEGEGTNEGKNRGRICWQITGTLCSGKVQGTFAKKQLTCFDCKFFKKVREEEGENFCLMVPVTKMVNNI